MSTNQIKPVAVLVHHKYQELEFWYPLLRLREEGIEAKVVGLDGETTYVSHLGYPVIPDIGVAEAASESFSGVVVPGGAAASLLAAAPEIVTFVKAAAAKGAVIGGVSQAAELLAKAGLVEKAKPVAGVVTSGKVVLAGDANDLPGFFRDFSGILAKAS